jgi:hypothetical protein
MSLKLGGSKSKSKTTASRTYNETTTPTVPEWASTLTQGQAGRIGGLGGMDPNSLIAPANPLQQRAAATVADLSGHWWNLNKATAVQRAAMGAGANTAQSASLLDGLDNYMSPYRKDVVDAALSDYDFGAGQTRAQQDLEMLGAGAFGGSGQALTRSMTEDGLARGRATTSANLLDQMFQRGSALSSEDAGRRQQSGHFNAQQQDAAQQRQLAAARDLMESSMAYEGNLRANAQAMMDHGGAMRVIEQERLQAPVTYAGQIGALLSGLPIQLFTGEQKSGTDNSVGTSKSKESNWSVSFDAEAAVKKAIGIP